jgi:HAD superfamily hydrolase (TIGR01509 family)
VTTAYELVIFDCDGVLVDSERLGLRIDQEFVAGLGWPLTEAEIVDRFVGRTVADVVADIEAHVGPVPPETLERWADQYRKRFATDLVVVDGIVEALDELERQNAVTCVASSSTHSSLRRKLDLTGLWQRFEGRIFSATDVANGKPAPDVFLYAAEHFGAEPRRCAVVEDSRHGVEAARAAGMRVFAYAGGVTPAGRLEGRDTVVFTDMRELPAMLASPA